MIAINHHPSARELRQFAAIWLAAVGMLAWRASHHGHPELGLALGIAAVAVCLTGLAAPAAIRPVWLGLGYATAPAGWIVSYLLLGMVYFVLLTAVALWFRLAGRDRLARRFEPRAESYWQPRRPPRAPRDYYRQY